MINKGKFFLRKLDIQVAFFMLQKVILKPEISRIPENELSASHSSGPLHRGLGWVV